jgi:predicted RNase H-like HicB family nuclease
MAKARFVCYISPKEPSMNRHICVTAAWDPEAQVWYIASSDLPGLHLEGATMEELLAQLPGAIEDLLEGQPGEVSFDLIGKVGGHVKVAA